MLCVRFDQTASAVCLHCHVYNATTGLVISALANTLVDVIFSASLLSTIPAFLAGMLSNYICMNYLVFLLLKDLVDCSFNYFVSL